MKFALAVYGSRGDVEPHAAVGRELLRRGHEVRMAVPPDLRGLAESAGITAVDYGPDTRDVLFGKKTNPIRLLSTSKGFFGQTWADMGSTLASLTHGADLLLTAVAQQGLAANVAEYQGIPLACLHWMPMRVNGRLLPGVPSPLIRSAVAAFWSGYWQVTKTAEEDQRRRLGLPKAIGSSTRRIVESGSLEIQAYDDFLFPGLAAEWAEWGDRRPFVGALTLELPTAVDAEVLSWIAAGTPPIYFGFGSTPVRSHADTVAMISAACAQLGERALIYSGADGWDCATGVDHVKMVGALNYATVFPACRAIVHHGGAGTTAASMRAGVPTLVLWIRNEQPLWGAVVKRMNVGAAQRLSSVTEKSLVASLRSILRPEYALRAREVAARMTKPSVSATAAADLLENAAQRGQFG
ncbi:glycosyltransferase [Mycobacterium sp. 4858]|uniref:glycosyltransferase n=1 Tax=Mycobacterium sp. 4858 TaxID=2057185 RepID=UPI000C8232E6|nr:glycosyltransferase [Mycobacterium sp. 4858]